MGLIRSIPTPLSVSRNTLAATSIGDYALFGGGYFATQNNTVDAYDTSLTRTLPTALSAARYDLAATSVGDYALFGGGYRSGYSSIVDAYDTSLTRSVPTVLSVARRVLAGASVGDYALFAGGFTGSESGVIDAYDTSLTRSVPTVLSVVRRILAGASVGDYALFAGGFTGSASGVVDAYNTSLTRSTPTPLSLARYSLAGASVGDYALFAGGDGIVDDAVDAYDTSLTRTIPTVLSVARDSLAGGSIGNYAVFAGGGFSSFQNTVDAYDTSLTRSTPTPLSLARGLLAAASVGDYVLFGGGKTATNVVDAYEEEEEVIITPTGVASTLLFGEPSVKLIVAPVGIGSTVSFGMPNLSIIHIIKWLEEPRITTRGPIATHITVKSRSNSYTVHATPEPDPADRIERLVEIQEGNAAACQAVAEELLDKWSADQVSVVGKIPLTVTLSFKEYIHVYIEWANIDREMVIQEKEHNITEQYSVITCGDIQVSDEELIARILDELANKDDRRRFGDETDYVDFDKTGFQTMAGAARPWRDELNDAINIEKQGITITIDETEGVVNFSATADRDDYMYLNVQLNHDKDLTAIINPHIHWFSDNEANVPNFMLKYRWQINGGTKTTAWTEYLCNIPFFSAPGAGVTIQQICYGARITPPGGVALSDIIQFRIIRDNDNDSGLFSGADPFSGSVGVLSFDLHFMINSLGSDAEWVK